MEMSKHTPGPWRTEPEDRHMCVFAGKPKASKRNYIHHGCDGLLPERSDAETLANARLIAAAPDMLKMLELLYAGDGVDLGPHDDGVEAVIAKAKGE